jgi:hypothetical protein
VFGGSHEEGIIFRRISRKGGLKDVSLKIRRTGTTGSISSFVNTCDVRVTTIGRHPFMGSLSPGVAGRGAITPDPTGSNGPAASRKNRPGASPITYLRPSGKTRTRLRMGGRDGSAFPGTN